MRGASIADWVKAGDTMRVAKARAMMGVFMIRLHVTDCRSVQAEWPMPVMWAVVLCNECDVAHKDFE